MHYACVETAFRSQCASSEHSRMKTITLRIDSKDHALLLALATRERMSMTALLMRLLDRYAETVPPVTPKKPSDALVVDGELLEFDE